MLRIFILIYQSRRVSLLMLFFITLTLLNSTFAAISGNAVLSVGLFLSAVACAMHETVAPLVKRGRTSMALSFFSLYVILLGISTFLLLSYLSALYHRYFG